MDVHFHMFGSKPTQKYIFLCLWCDLTLSMLFSLRRPNCICALKYLACERCCSATEKKWTGFSDHARSTQPWQRDSIWSWNDARTSHKMNELKLKNTFRPTIHTQMSRFFDWFLLARQLKVSSLNLSRKMQVPTRFPLFFLLFSNNFRWDRASGFRFWQRRKSVRFIPFGNTQDASARTAKTLPIE